MNRKMALTGVFVVVVLTGCAVNQSNGKDITAYEPASNKAEVYCAQRGGELAALTENNKRVKYCVFSSDNRIEINEYYEKRHQHYEN